MSLSFSVLLALAVPFQGSRPAPLPEAASVAAVSDDAAPATRGADDAGAAGHARMLAYLADPARLEEFDEVFGRIAGSEPPDRERHG